MIEKEQEIREEQDPGFEKKKLTYDEFMDDPFGKKQKEVEEYYEQQRRGIKSLTDKEEKGVDRNPFG